MYNLFSTFSDQTADKRSKTSCVCSETMDKTVMPYTLCIFDKITFQLRYLVYFGDLQSGSVTVIQMCVSQVLRIEGLDSVHSTQF